MRAHAVAAGVAVRPARHDELAAVHPAHRLYTRLGFTRLPERDWQPVPGLRLVAFGRAAAHTP